MLEAINKKDQPAAPHGAATYLVYIHVSVKLYLSIRKIMFSANLRIK